MPVKLFLLRVYKLLVWIFNKILGIDSRLARIESGISANNTLLKEIRDMLQDQGTIEPAVDLGLKAGKPQEQP